MTLGFSDINRAIIDKKNLFHFLQVILSLTIVSLIPRTKELYDSLGILTVKPINGKKMLRFYWKQRRDGIKVGNYYVPKCTRYL